MTIKSNWRRHEPFIVLAACLAYAVFVVAYHAFVD
jgi:hypothetical protein